MGNNLVALDTADCDACLDSGPDCTYCRGSSFFDSASACLCNPDPWEDCDDVAFGSRAYRTHVACSPGETAAVVLACILIPAAILTCGIVACCCCCRRSHKKKTEGDGKYEASYDGVGVVTVGGGITAVPMVQISTGGGGMTPVGVEATVYTNNVGFAPPVTVPAPYDPMYAQYSHDGGAVPSAYPPATSTLPKCYGCEQPIDGDKLICDDQQWHKSCFLSHQQQNV
ncbi:hypothetical protein Pelo_207 [Pelomyxa schiedti]|nr:hypothetical protein Pelo_204 [Pelomyxa schiedti]KAH3767914.1 hypothetical protein Pelo_207 [Pelomyxa schiedti]